MTRGIGNLQEKPVSNESKLVAAKPLIVLSSVYTLCVGVCSKELYWKCFIDRAANDWSTGFVWQLMYQSIPKPPIPPPGQSPGIWLALSSVQWGIWPKMRPAWWGIWLSCQDVCQRSGAKGFCKQVSRIHGSLLLSIPRGFFCCCRFI